MTKRITINRTVSLVPGGDVPVRLPAGAGILVENVIVRVVITGQTTAAGTAVKLDAPGFALAKLSVDYNGKIIQAMPGWYAWAGSPERDAARVATVLGSDASGLGVAPADAAVGVGKSCVSKFVVDFSTVDGLRPKDSALDMDALGQGGEANLILSGCQWGDLFTGAAAGTFVSYTAYVTITYIREKGVRGRDWTPPKVQKRVSYQTVDLAVAGDKELIMPRGGSLRSVTLRQGQTTVPSPVYAAFTHLRVASLPDVFVDCDTVALYDKQILDIGPKPVGSGGAYLTWDTTRDGSGVVALADLIDTVGDARDPRMTLTAAGIASTSAQAVFCDYLPV
jgi:hypothetical protein